MASELKFDELNRLTHDYREYFGKMFITPEEMRSRIDFAEQIEDVMLWLFAYLLIAEEAEIPMDEVKQDAIVKLTSVVEKRTRLDPYIEKHINDVINEVVDVTEERTRRKKDEEENEDADEDIDKILEDEQNALNNQNDSDLPKDGGNGNKKDYWTSKDRAMLISENEANAFDNYIQYREAKAQGKTKKTWITELDDRVRFTHILAEGQTIDIDGLFFVGGSKFRFPKDAEYDPAPSEVINCRCVCEYL